MRRLNRQHSAVMAMHVNPEYHVYNFDQEFASESVVFGEIGQGYSLGLLSGLYPHVTTRECTPAQLIADLGVSPRVYRKSIVSLRLRPIRTGNLEAHGKVYSSGPGYPDQKEIEWSDIFAEPEISTVTKRQRRIFEWSDIQYKQMLLATQPDALFFNFCNYHVDWPDQVKQHMNTYQYVLGRRPDFVLTGHGPKVENVRLYT